MDEGFIKFNCNWIKTDPLPYEQINEINTFRNKLFQAGLIGAYENGIGYGNISIRHEKKSFIISGSMTGKWEQLNENHYVLVNEYCFKNNSLTCKGPIKASSESLSHAMVYECSSEINAVIHIHNLNLWKKLLHKMPTTQETISFGTPEIAFEIKRLFRENNVQQEKIIVMGGHKEGIITFGKDLPEAYNVLLEKL